MPSTRHARPVPKAAVWALGIAGAGVFVYAVVRSVQDGVPDWFTLHTGAFLVLGSAAAGSDSELWRFGLGAAAVILSVMSLILALGR